jgi:hypothetical protein
LSFFGILEEQLVDKLRAKGYKNVTILARVGKVPLGGNGFFQGSISLANIMLMNPENVFY